MNKPLKSLIHKAVLLSQEENSYFGKDAHSFSSFVRRKIRESIKSGELYKKVKNG